MKECWDIKEKCPFRVTDPADAKCPAFADQMSCWEFDWLDFYRAMPDGPEKEKWKYMMLEWCANCEIRDSHGMEVDSPLAKLGRM